MKAVSALSRHDFTLPVMTFNNIRLKSPVDIDRIEKAGRIIAEIFSLIKQKNIIGLSTWELDTFIDARL